MLLCYVVVMMSEEPVSKVIIIRFSVPEINLLNDHSLVVVLKL